MDGRFVAYYRVSTKRQGQSGLGLEGQQAAVAAYLNGGSWTMLASFTEIESGTNSNRPQLAAALAECRMTGATLVVAKLDRLARSAHFLLGLQASSVEFVAVDMPYANRLTVGVMALVAEEEARAISSRTKAALVAAKARGAKLGGARAGSPPLDPAAGLRARQDKAAAYAREIGPIAAALRVEGASLRRIAVVLTERGIKTPRNRIWTAAAVSTVLQAIKTAPG